MNLIVANTIAKQIGHRAFSMMGTTFKTGGGNCLTFDVKTSRTISHIRVTLAPNDTYTVSFLNCRRGKNVQTDVDGVYADGLNQLIEVRTGLCLSL